MKYPVYNQRGEKLKDIVLPKEIFEQELLSELLQQVVVAQQANRRSVIAHTKIRSEVSGGGRKPWRQKGTGRARHGSIRSPIWRGGGITFGPRKDKNYKQKINRKMAQKALLIALSTKAKDQEMKILDKISLPEPKTKLMQIILDKLSLPGSIMIVINKDNRLLKRAGRNLEKTRIVFVEQINALDLLSYRNLLITLPAIENLKERFLPQSEK
jgi:large subunit ribosomal protein L4